MKKNFNKKDQKVKIVSGFLLPYTIHIKDGLKKSRAKIALVIIKHEMFILLWRTKPRDWRPLPNNVLEYKLSREIVCTVSGLETQLTNNREQYERSQFNMFLWAPAEPERQLVLQTAPCHPHNFPDLLYQFHVSFS